MQYWKSDYLINTSSIKHFNVSAFNGMAIEGPLPTFVQPLKQEIPISSK